jgi:hypothetical protein
MFGDQFLKTVNQLSPSLMTSAPPLIFEENRRNKTLSSRPFIKTYALINILVCFFVFHGVAAWEMTFCLENKYYHVLPV